MMDRHYDIGACRKCKYRIPELIHVYRRDFVSFYSKLKAVFSLLFNVFGSLKLQEAFE